MPAAVDLSLELDQISCRFASRDDPGKPYLAVSQASLAVREGEFVSIVGPTGCGKSTLLNVAAGLLAPSEGSVRVHGKPLAGINRDAGYMFQADALMPWRSAIDNVTAGLEFRGFKSQLCSPDDGTPLQAHAFYLKPGLADPLA